MKLLSAAAFFVGLLVTVVHAQVAPTIVSISNSRRLTQGESLSLSVSANGTSPFTFQWKKGGTAISGATASTYSIESLATTDAGSYSVTITNAGGAVTSSDILIDVTPATAPSFWSQPGNLIFTVGDTISIYASVSGTGPMTYVWKREGTTLATTTSYNYSKASAVVADGGSYTVTVTNVAGSVTSSPFTVTVNPLTAPVFESNPSNRTVESGGYFSFYASVSNWRGVTFQWKKDGVAITGATYSSYSKDGATAADAGSYTAVATNSVGSATSSAATLTVNPPVAPSRLSITAGPVTVTLGETLSLYSSVSGSGALTYQWKKDGANISGATSYSYYKSNVTADDAGVYSLVVSNSVGSVTSTETTVSITAAQIPIITRHPVSSAVYPGGYVSFSVDATGTGPLTYQWKKDGVVVGGETGRSYYVSSSAAATDAGVYTVVVTNAQGSATSQPATLDVRPPVEPTILTQPAGVTVLPGGYVQLGVTATGRPEPTYQWKKDGVAIAGATSSSFYRWNAASTDSGSYTVDVINTAGTVTSQPATVAVLAADLPVIKYHPPTSVSLLAGEYVNLWAYAQNSNGTTYKWYRNNVEIPNATGDTYSISDAQPASAGTYKAVVTNAAGSVTTYESVVTVDLSSARPVITRTSGSLGVRGGDSEALQIEISPSVTSYTIAWKKDGVAIPNASSKTLSLSNFSQSLTGTYTAEVTVGVTTYTSLPIVVSMLNFGVAPRIIRQPASMTRLAGDWTSFWVETDGEMPITYQWRKGGVDIPGKTSSSYDLGSLTAAYAGDYTVVVTNRAGSVTSTVATLAVRPSADVGAPVISWHPASRTLTAGSYSLDLTVQLLNATNDTAYQWYKNDAAISGATGSYYYSSPVTTATTGRYKVVVTNGAGSTTSQEAIVVVTAQATGPTFTTQPASQEAFVGGSATFTAVATGGTVSYQWRKNGTAISNATGATLTLTNLQTSDAGNYTVLAANADGSTSSTIATLTLTAAVPPSITTQPASQISGRSGSVTFRVVATGTPAPSYQWKKNGTDLAGATAATLALSNLAAGDAGNYSVVVSNAAGSVTSNSVVLTVYDQLPYAPTFTTQPVGGTCAPGQSITLLVAVSAFPAAEVQWYKNGALISGAQSTTLSLGKMSADLEGQYHCVASNPLGSAVSHIATLVLGTDPQRLVNVSSRGIAGKDANTLIAGLVISGSAPKSVMIRAVGPSLVPLGVPNALPNPRLRLFKGTTQILENDDWSTGGQAAEISAASARLGAFTLAAGTADAAFITQLNPGAYTAHVTTNDASTGAVLLEVYDADNPGDSATRVVNLSSRGPVGTGDDILIVGFVINGSAPKKVLVRGVGPALTPLGVTGALADPTLQLYAGSKLINENDNWSAGTDAAQVTAAATACGAATLTVGSKDAAILVELQPGVYSAHVRGVGATTGVALVEVYEVP